jgi:hypothetical protein
MEEIWKDINDFEGHYQISNFGRVKSLARTRKGSGTSIVPVLEKIKNTRVNKKNGYKIVDLFKDNKKSTCYVHILVVEAFVRELNFNGGEEEVNHKDGNKKNNYDWNLEIITHTENIQHAFANNLIYHKGENNAAHKYNEEFIKQIRTELNSGVRNKDICDKYNLPSSTVSQIKTGINWSHI